MDRVVLRRPAARVAVLLLRQNRGNRNDRARLEQPPLLAPRRHQNRPRRPSRDSARIIGANDLD
jgi:hypothetical protein